MFGKHFTSMYEGSMIGRGSCFFAVWGYVISHFVPDRKVGAWVELNPKLLGFVLGESESKVDEAIQEMCRPDPKSRTKHMDGRKLVKLGEYSYQVVNGEQYRAIRDEETRREQNRAAQQKFRRKKVVASASKLRGEDEVIAAERNGATPEQVDEIITSHLPDKCKAGPVPCAACGSINCHGCIRPS